MTVLIVDYGMGNLASVERAIEKIGARPLISKEPERLKEATHVILPGVGSFRRAMENLVAVGWDVALREEVKNRGVPFLGICLGMQLLATEGFEDGHSAGLNLIPGKVVHMSEGLKCSLRLPHVGWNEIHLRAPDDMLIENIADRTDFYFVHSYCFQPTQTQSVVADTPYGESFATIIRNQNVWGAQFHPEKSGPAGAQLLKNFLSFSSHHA